MLVSIEGNIGSGKSTLMEAIRLGCPGVVTVPEPIDAWTAPCLPSGRSMLQAFYDAPASNAFAFQMHVLQTRLQRMPEPRGDAAVVLERSLDSVYECFVMKMRDTRLMREEEFKVYTDWHEHCRQQPLDGLVYLRCPPDECMRRIEARKRHGETLEMAYLDDIHARHEKYVSTATSRGGRVLQLDGALSGPDALQTHVRAVRDFVDLLRPGAPPPDEGKAFTSASVESGWGSLQTAWSPM